MSVLRKTYPVSVKALGDEKSGRVEAIVSVFGNVDLGGDRVQRGAFAKSIEKWKSSGFPVPVVFSHDWGDLWSHIGAVDSLEETEQGLKATYTLDVADNPAAAQVYRLMKRGTLKEHSFAYTVVDQKTAKDGATDLTELDIIEVGPTLKGMNPETEVLAVKSALEQVTAEHEKAADDATPEIEAKAGARLSQATKAQIQGAITALESARDALAPLLSGSEPEPEKSSDEDDAEGKADDADTSVKSIDPELLSLIKRLNEAKE